MKNHKQYNIDDYKNEKDQTNSGMGFVNPNKDSWVSTPSVVRTDKDLIIKDFYKFTNTEASLVKGQKIKMKQFKSGDSSTLQILLDDFLISVSDTIISRTVKLPNPSIAGIGKLYVISDMSGSALTTTITISPFNTELINGDTGTSINTNYGTVRLTTDGTNWFIIN